MPNEMPLIDAEMRARALSRWENEGGSITVAGAAHSNDESELRILTRLGEESFARYLHEHRSES